MKGYEIYCRWTRKREVLFGGGKAVTDGRQVQSSDIVPASQWIILIDFLIIILFLDYYSP